MDGPGKLTQSDFHAGIMILEWMGLANLPSLIFMLVPSVLDGSGIVCIASIMSNAISLMYTTWNFVTTGAPETTIYASPIVSTYNIYKSQLYGQASYE